MNNQNNAARSRKVIEFPIPKTGEDPNKTKSIDQQVFELLCRAKPIKEPALVPSPMKWRLFL